MAMGSASWHHERFPPVASDTKSEAHTVLGKLVGLWRPFNPDLKERMSELYTKVGNPRTFARGT